MNGRVVCNFQIPSDKALGRSTKIHRHLSDKLRIGPPYYIAKCILKNITGSINIVDYNFKMYSHFLAVRVGRWKEEKRGCGTITQPAAAN